MTARAVAQPAAPAGGSAARITVPRLRALVWVAWRQQRVSLGFLALVAAALTAYLVWSGLSTRSALAAMARAHCNPTLVSGACLALEDHRVDTYGPQWLVALPVLAALFAGAPLIARGYENGALRFSLTQGVRRARWAIPQLTVTAGTGVILCIVPALAGAWWLTQQQAPYVPEPWRWDRTLFNVTPIMLPCWLLAAIAIAALAAVICRRAVPAMAATLASAVGLAIAVSSLRLLPGALLGIGARAVRQTVPPALNSCNGVACSWADPADQPHGNGIIVDGWFDHAGHRLTASTVAARIPPKLFNASPSALTHWLSAQHYAYWISYQPDNRFWLLQGIQAGVLVAVAVALGALAMWLLCRRSI